MEQDKLIVSSLGAEEEHLEISTLNKILVIIRRRSLRISGLFAKLGRQACKR